MDDVTFSRNGRDAERWMYHAATVINDVAIAGRSLMSTNACYFCNTGYSYTVTKSARMWRGLPRPQIGTATSPSLPDYVVNVDSVEVFKNV